MVLTPTAVLLLAASPGGAEVARPAPTALLAAKALTCAGAGPAVVDGAVVLIRDGRIERVGARAELAMRPNTSVERVYVEGTVAYDAPPPGTGRRPW